MARVVAVVLCLALVRAQQPAPTFRGGVELVTLDVSVIDRDGRPVRDLTLADFALRVDAQPRPLAGVQFIDYTQLRETAPAPIVAGAPAAFGSNDIAAGRIVLFLLDLPNIKQGEGRTAFASMGSMIERFSSSDRLSIMTLGGGEPNVPFTADHGRLKDALGRAVGRRMPAISANQVSVGIEEALAIERGDKQALISVIDRECTGFIERKQAEGIPPPALTCKRLIELEARETARNAVIESRTTLRNLRSIVEALGRFEGPKTLVFLSQGFAHDEQHHAEYSQLAAAAAMARVSIRAMQIDTAAFDATTQRPPGAASADLDARTLGLDNVADRTGGTRTAVVGTGAGVFDRLTSELSGSYVLSFEPTAADRDGASHRVDVTVNRAGTTVRARQEFAIGKTAAPRSTKEQIAWLLRTPLLSSDLPLRITAYSVRGEGPRIKLMIAAIGRAPGASLPAAFGWEVTTPEGKGVTGGMEEIPAGAAPTATTAPRVHVAAASVEPGKYVVKVALIEDAARRASAEIAVDAKLTAAGPYRLSDLMIGQAVDGTFRPRAEVRRGDAMLYGEVYKATRIEPGEIEVLVEVAPAADSPPLLGAVASLQATKDPTRQVAVAPIDTTTLAPRDYLARMILMRSGQRLGEVTRTLRIVP